MCWHIRGVHGAMTTIRALSSRVADAQLNGCAQAFASSLICPYTPGASVYSGSLWRVAGARRVGTVRGTMDWLSLTVTLRRSRQRCTAGAGLPFAEGRPRKTRVKIAEAVCASAVGRIGSRSWGGIKKHGRAEAENAGPCGGQRLCARTHEACRDQSRSRGRRSWFPISPVASSALCPSAFASGAVFLHRSSKI